jgi:hypothetical protein
MTGHSTVPLRSIVFRLFACGIVATAAFNGGASAMTKTLGFYQMIQTLLGADRLDLQTVEETVGMHLRPVSIPMGGYPYSRQYQVRGQRVTFNDVSINGIDYYEYDKGFGPKVSVTIGGGCITESDLRSHYGNLKTILLDPNLDVELVEEGPMGTATFGFLRQDCLAYVTVVHKER